MGIRDGFDQLSSQAEAKWGGKSVLVVIVVAMVIGVVIGAVFG